jgi:hypothetical protein
MLAVEVLHRIQSMILAKPENTYADGQKTAPAGQARRYVLKIGGIVHEPA